MTDLQDTISDIYSSLQTRLGSNEACHFLALCSIAHEATGRQVDICNAIITAYTHNLIEASFYVKDALGLLFLLTGHNWKVRSVQELPKNLKKNEFTEIKWRNPNTGKVHFTRRYVDTLRNSVTVRDGTIEEYRIYEEL